MWKNEKWQVNLFLQKAKNKSIYSRIIRNKWSILRNYFKSLNTIQFWGNFDKSSASKITRTRTTRTRTRTAPTTTKAFLRSLTHYMLPIKNADTSTVYPQISRPDYNIFDGLKSILLEITLQLIGDHFILLLLVSFSHILSRRNKLLLNGRYVDNFILMAFRWIQQLQIKTVFWILLPRNCWHDRNTP